MNEQMGDKMKKSFKGVCVLLLVLFIICVYGQTTKANGETEGKGHKEGDEKRPFFHVYVYQPLCTHNCNGNVYGNMPTSDQERNEEDKLKAKLIEIASRFLDAIIEGMADGIRDVAKFEDSGHPKILLAQSCNDDCHNGLEGLSSVEETNQSSVSELTMSKDDMRNWTSKWENCSNGEGNTVCKI